jgi:hypothetical protein
MKPGDPVAFISEKVTLSDYLVADHLVIVSPGVMTKEMIKRDFRWDSTFVLPATLLGYPYEDYYKNHELEVEKDGGIPYIQKFDEVEGMYRYERIVARTPKLVTQKSFMSIIEPLRVIRNDVKSNKAFDMRHLSGLVYEYSKNPDKLIIQSFRGLIFEIYKRYLQPL